MKPITEDSKKELIKLVIELEKLHDGSLLRQNLYDLTHKAANKQLNLTTDELRSISVLYTFLNSVSVKIK